MYIFIKRKIVYHKPTHSDTNKYENKNSKKHQHF